MQVGPYHHADLFGCGASGVWSLRMLDEFEPFLLIARTPRIVTAAMFRSIG